MWVVLVRPSVYKGTECVEGAVPCTQPCIAVRRPTAGLPALPTLETAPATGPPTTPAPPPVRYTWLAAKREPWTPQRHQQWPPLFKAAVQHLLLMHHTGRAGAGESEGGGGPLTRGKRARLDLAQRRATSAFAAPLAAAAAAAEPAVAEGAAAQPAAAAAKAGGSKAGVRPAQPRGLKRGRAAAGAQDEEPREAAPLASLPKELLLRIIGEAAYPISAWV